MSTCRQAHVFHVECFPALVQAFLAPVYVTYDKGMIDRAIQFFQREAGEAGTGASEGGVLQALGQQAAAQMEELRRRAERQLQYALLSKKRILMYLDLEAPKVAVPLGSRADGGGSLGTAVLDLGHLELRTSDEVRMVGLGSLFALDNARANSRCLGRPSVLPCDTASRFGYPALRASLTHCCYPLGKHPWQVLDELSLTAEMKGLYNCFSVSLVDTSCYFADGSDFNWGMHEPLLAALRRGGGKSHEGGLPMARSLVEKIRVEATVMAGRRGTLLLPQTKTSRSCLSRLRCGQALAGLLNGISSALQAAPPSVRTVLCGHQGPFRRSPRQPCPPEPPDAAPRRSSRAAGGRGAADAGFGQLAPGCHVSGAGASARLRGNRVGAAVAFAAPGAAEWDTVRARVRRCRDKQPDIPGRGGPGGSQGAEGRYGVALMPVPATTSLLHCIFLVQLPMELVGAAAPKSSPWATHALALIPEGTREAKVRSAVEDGDALAFVCDSAEEVGRFRHAFLDPMSTAC